MAGPWVESACLHHITPRQSISRTIIHTSHMQATEFEMMLRGEKEEGAKHCHHAATTTGELADCHHYCFAVAVKCHPLTPPHATPRCCCHAESQQLEIGHAARRRRRRSR